MPEPRLDKAQAAPRSGATVNVLVTGSRLPFALEKIRKLGRCGHHVVASDSFRCAPGNHSRHAAERLVTASPRDDTGQFLRDLEGFLRGRGIDRVSPSFEEEFYIARHRERFEPYAEIFTPSFNTLRRLHDKAAMLELAGELGLRVPPTRLARSIDELKRLTDDLPRFFARPAYTRGGVTLFTNCGPLTGEVALNECVPSPQNPFLVQAFVDGRDICTYSIAQHGRVAAHATYVHPLTLENAGGIVFESIEMPATLAAVRAVVEATRYHGEISFDFLETDDGLLLVECNPRSSSGLTVMPDEMFDDGMWDRVPGRTLVAPAGIRRQLSLALIRNMLTHRSTIADNAAALASGARDIYLDRDDLAPLVYQLVSYARVIDYRIKTRRISRSDLMQGYFDDLTWDGQDIVTGPATGGPSRSGVRADDKRSHTLRQRLRERARGPSG